MTPLETTPVAFMLPRSLGKNIIQSRLSFQPSSLARQRLNNTGIHLLPFLEYD